MTRIHLIGITILALAAGARAESSITPSGYLDLGISKKTGTSAQLGTLGASNAALSGSQDISAGLTAIFRLSTRFDINTGTLENSDAQRPFFKDEATIGLKGDFGTVRLGRACSAIWQYSWMYDGWANFDRIASPQWYAFAPSFLTNPQTREYIRLNNAVFYDSPTYQGLTAHVAAAVDRESTDLTHGVSGSLKYDSGPVSLMLGLEQNSQKDRLLFLGASYKFSALQVMGGYSLVKLNPDGAIYGPEWTNWAGASNPTTRHTGLTLSALYTVGASTYKVGLGRNFQGSTNGFNYIGSTFDNAGTGYSGPTTMASLGYSYALSRTVTLIADLSHSKWKYKDDAGRESANGAAVGGTLSF